MVFMLATLPLWAQDEVETSLETADTTEASVKVIPFQLTLVSPLGTNGLSSGKVANNVSINIFAGISGGVYGMELGGLANFSKGDVIGLQAASLLNGGLGQVKGAQLSGIGNYNKDKVVGLQASGLLNVNTAEVLGTQMSGIMNYSMKNFTGFQGSGILNTHIGTFTGLQAAGITNVTTKSFTGAQLSAITNTIVGDLQGLQLSMVNVTTKTTSGAQLGLFNYSRNVKGLQFGLINIADSVEKGAAIGLFTYVRHGYHKFEVESNETFYGNVTFKSGVKNLYMIYTAGFKHENGINYWAPGIGIGTLSRITNKIDLNTDLIVRQVNEGEWWTEELNMLNTLSLNFGYNISDKFAIYGGPSLNVMVSGIKDNEGNIVGGSFTPDWSFFDDTYDYNRVKMYVGVKAGIRF